MKRQSKRNVEVMLPVLPLLTNHPLRLLPPPWQPAVCLPPPLPSPHRQPLSPPPQLPLAISASPTPISPWAMETCLPVVMLMNWSRKSERMERWQIESGQPCCSTLEVERITRVGCWNVLQKYQNLLHIERLRKLRLLPMRIDRLIFISRCLPSKRTNMRLSMRLWESY